MTTLSTVDLVLVLVVIAAAAGFLLWHLVARESKPACHLAAGARCGSGPAGGMPAAAGAVGMGDVVLGAGLARGLERARSRQTAARSR